MTRTLGGRLVGAALIALLPLGTLTLTPVLWAASHRRNAKPAVEARNTGRHLTPRQQLGHDLTISRTLKGPFPAHPPIRLVMCGRVLTSSVAQGGGWRGTPWPGTGFGAEPPSKPRPSTREPRVCGVVMGSPRDRA